MVSHRFTGSAVPLIYYEIRVAGTLPPGALSEFEQRISEAEPTETYMHGPVSDQAALSALLARLEELGVQVAEIRRLPVAPG